MGATGTVGSAVVEALVERGAKNVRALTRHPGKATLPEGVTAVGGDPIEPGSMRNALQGVRTLFVLNPVVADELTRSLTTLSLARDAGIERFVYLSMLNADKFLDTPHGSAKLATEQMVAGYGLPTTILRPAYYYQNDAMLKLPILTLGQYPMPIGSLGTAMIDVRDIGELAAIELIRRNEAVETLPCETIEIAGPNRFTGASIAHLWSEISDRAVDYVGDDLNAFEQQMRHMVEPWQALDLTLMFGGFQRDGMMAADGTNEEIARRIGRPLHRYRDFATATMGEWRHSPADLAGTARSAVSGAIDTVRDAIRTH